MGWVMDGPHTSHPSITWGVYEGWLMDGTTRTLPYVRERVFIHHLGWWMKLTCGTGRAGVGTSTLHADGRCKVVKELCNDRAMRFVSCWLQTYKNRTTESKTVVLAVSDTKNHHQNWRPWI